MTKKYLKLSYILLLSVFLNGCWDYKDVNKRSVTLSVGVDDINKNVEFTGEIAKLAQNSFTNKEKSEVAGVYKYDSIGKHFEESRADFDNKIAFQDFSGALRVIVFSKKYAEKGIESYVNRVYFAQGFRSSLLMAVSKEATKDLFAGNVENDISIGYAIEDTVKYLSESGGGLYKTIQEIQSDIQFGDIGYLMPYVTRENNVIKYLGLAAMKDSKLIAIVKSDESNGFLAILSDKFSSKAVIPIPSDEKNLFSIKTSIAKKSIKTSYEEGKINIDIDIKLKSELQYEYSIKQVSDYEIKEVEDTISKKMKESITSAIKLSQDQFNCDVFGFARYFKADNYNAYKKIDWQKEYQKVNFNVNVETKVVNTNILDKNDGKSQ